MHKYQKINQFDQLLKSNQVAKATDLLLSIEKEENGPKTIKYINALKSKYNFPQIENQCTSLNHKKSFDLSKYQKLSELDELQTLPGVSIVSCCMNRNDNLKKGLKTWLKLPVDEIIIVDWSSTTPVSETLADIDDARIKIIRVEGEPKWILTYGFNVGLRAASFNKIYKLDADIEVSKDFLMLNDFTESEFVRGHWKSALDNGQNDQVYVNGSFGCYKKHLKEIGFYNEFIRTYGWDDSDLYERLSSQCGLATKFLSFNSIIHMDQNEEDRTSNQDVIMHQLLNEVPVTEFNNFRNKYIARTADYWSVGRLQNYALKKHNKNVWCFRRETSDIIISSNVMCNANISATRQFIWHKRSDIFRNTNDFDSISEIVFHEYLLKINLEDTLTLLGVGGNKSDIYYFDTEKVTLQQFVRDKALSINAGQKCYVLVNNADYTSVPLINLHPGLRVVMMENKLLIALSQIRNKNGVKSFEINSASEANLEFIKTHKNYLSVLNNKKKVYVDTQHGLGNRLRAIASASAIAVKTNRELIIVWEPDHHCECQLKDIFDYDGIVINKTFVAKAKQTMSVFNYMEAEEGANKDEIILIDDNKDLYLRAAYTFNSEFSTWDAENEFLRKLKPAKAVQDLIESLDLTNCIGAHIRMEAGAGLDHNTYDSIENWTQDGHDQLHYWREKSHYSNFIKRIDQLFKEDKQSKLFLATDMPETYKVFEEYYGDRLVYLKRDVYDRSKEQIIFGLADAILLSQCQSLLGSTWSSFSELALRLSTTFKKIEMSGADF